MHGRILFIRGLCHAFFFVNLLVRLLYLLGGGYPAVEKRVTMVMDEIVSPPLKIVIFTS